MNESNNTEQGITYSEYLKLKTTVRWLESLNKDWSRDIDRLIGESRGTLSRAFKIFERTTVLEQTTHRLNVFTLELAKVQLKIAKEYQEKSSISEDSLKHLEEVFERLIAEK